MSHPSLTPTEINRANAKHSTGPKTKEGKHRSSQNALRHGLTGQLVVMPSEDLQAYRRHLTSFTDEYKPQGATENHLVQALADVSWRLNRVVALEANLQAADFKALANFSLHSQRLSRQFERTLAQLRDLQKTRRARETTELDELLDLMVIHEEKGEAYDPSDDGFVFSEAQIEHAIQLRNRKILIAESA